MNKDILAKAFRLLKEYTLCPFHDKGIELSKCSEECDNNIDGICWREYLENMEDES